MKTYDAKQLAGMKKHFIDWLDTTWCECNALRKADREHFNDELIEYHIKPDGWPCECYGRDEFDTIHHIEIDDDNTIRMPMTDHDNPTQLDPDQRCVLYTPDDDEIYTHYPHICYGGDDYDYYQPIVRWILATLTSGETT